MKQTNLLPTAVTHALSNTNDLVTALYSRPESLGALLPYDEYLPDLGMFRQKDGSLGAIYEVECLEHETKVGEEIVSAVSALKGWFNWPTNCVLQLLLDQSYVSKRDKIWEELLNKYRGGNPFSERLFNEKVKMYRNSCQADSELAPLKRRFFVSIRHFLSEKQHKYIKKMNQKGELLLYSEMKDWIAECRAFQHSLMMFENASTLPMKRLDANEVLDLLRRFFNPVTYYKRNFAQYNSNLPISDQLIYHSPKLDYRGIEREGLQTRTITLKTNPGYAYPGGMAYFLELGFPMRFAINFKFPTQFTTNRFLVTKEFFLENAPSARLRRQKEDLLDIQNKLVRDDRCLHMTMSVVVEGETAEILEAREREIIGVFQNKLDCEAVVEDDIGMGLCLNTLPLNYLPSTDGSSQRFHRILRSDAIKFLPIFDSFRGLEKPIQLNLSRERNLVAVSLCDNPISNHTAVLGGSGGGKTLAVLDFVQAVKRQTPEPLIFVLDNKANYAMMSQYFDGELTLFKREEDMPFSPFRGIYDDEKVAFLARLILSGVKMVSPNFEFDSTHSTALAKAIRLAHAKKKQQAGLAYLEGELLEQPIDHPVEIRMQDIVAELALLTSIQEYEGFQEPIESLQRQLLPFYGEGIYAKYFDSPASPHSSNKKRSTRLYVYDLDNLTDPILRALMSMAVFEEIRQTIKLPEFAGIGGYVVIEELAVLGRNNPVASEMVIEFAETFRKLGYFLIGLTVDPKSYFEIPACQAMWSAAEHFLFTAMSSDQLAFLKKNSDFLNEADHQIIESLRTVKGSHSDVYYVNKKKTKKGVIRFRQTPLDRWLAPTNIRDIAQARKALKAFPDKWEALESLATEFPQGVPTDENS